MNQDRAMGDIISGIWTMEEGELSSSYLEIYLIYSVFFSDRKGRAICLRCQQVHRERPEFDTMGVSGIMT